MCLQGPEVRTRWLQPGIYCLLVLPGRLWKAGMRVFSRSCLMLLGNSENGEDTSHMYLTKHFSHPYDLPKSEQEVSERQNTLVSTSVEEKRQTGSSSVTFFM